MVRCGIADVDVVVAMNDYLRDLRDDEPQVLIPRDRLAARYLAMAPDDIEARIDEMLWVDDGYFSVVKRHFGTLTAKGEALLREHGIEPVRFG